MAPALPKPRTVPVVCGPCGRVAHLPLAAAAGAWSCPSCGARRDGLLARGLLGPLDLLAPAAPRPVFSESYRPAPAAPRR